MVELRKRPIKKPLEDSRELLLKAATQVFADKGFEGSTVKDIVDLAGVNVSLVSYYFNGKEGLYRSCLETFAIDRLEAAERILAAPQSRDEFKLRLRLFAEDFIDFHERQPDTCRIIHRGCDTMDPIAADVFRDVFLRIFNAMKSFNHAAKDLKILKDSVDTEILTGLMFGSLIHCVRSQEIARLLGQKTLDEPTHRLNFIDQWINCFSEGTCT